jgi:aminopeptidase N
LNTDSSLFSRINIAQILSNEIDNSLAQLDSSEWSKGKRLDEKKNLKIEVSNTDQFSTHPDIAKRIISLREQLIIYDQPENSQLFQIKDSASYSSIQHQLSHLALATAIDDFEYQTAIILVLTNKFQFDRDIRNTTLLKSLYFIAQSKENKYDEELLSKCAITIDSNMVDLNKILQAYDNDKFKKLIYGYAKKLVDQKQNEDTYFYYALCNEAFLGKQTSQIIFQNLLNKFPNGKYALVAKQKLAYNENK